MRPSCSLPVVNIRSQEIVIGLQSNSKLKKDNKISEKTIAAPDTISLPFLDDFSGNSVFPDRRKWDDDHVFINNTYSRNQITKGIATFDALDNKGDLYETASNITFQADRLTSKPINLDYPLSSDIYLSFLYEPGGLTDVPEANDSLSLQFYAPSDDTWHPVWRSGTSRFTGFRNVIIQVNHERFLKKGFRFRFINHASLGQSQSDPAMTGNCDIWNLDYILLNSGRHPADTIYHDVAFTLPVRSVLMNHEAMPWKHFRQVSYHEMGSPKISVKYRNNDNIERNVTRDFRIWDVYNNKNAHNFTGGATNVDRILKCRL
jgi:hypothetical protein